MGAFSTPAVCLSATNGKGLEGVKQRTTTRPTSARDAAKRTTEPRLALEARKHKAVTPYHPEEWRRALEGLDLINRYPHIPM
jgi:hypothetical protein